MVSCIVVRCITLYRMYDECMLRIVVICCRYINSTHVQRQFQIFNVCLCVCGCMCLCCHYINYLVTETSIRDLFTCSYPITFLCGIDARKHIHHLIFICCLYCDTPMS